MGSFSWGLECCMCKTRIIDVAHDASSNKLVHTKVLVKNCVTLTGNYAMPLGHKKGVKLTPEEEENLKKRMIKENSEEI